MLRAAIALALLAAAPAAAQDRPVPTSAPEPARVAAARELLDVIMPPEDRREMFRTIIDSMLNNTVVGIAKANDLEALFEKRPAVRAVFTGFVDRQKKLALDDLDESTPELMLAYANAYARRFTAAELAELTAFFASPLGRRYSREAGGIMADPEIGLWLQGISERSQKRVPAELERLMEEITPLLETEGKKRDS